MCPIPLRLNLASWSSLWIGEGAKKSKQLYDNHQVSFSSANATPEFEGRGGSDLAQELVLSLQNAYESPLAFDYRTLCLIPGQQCWKLYIDILVRLYSV